MSDISVPGVTGTYDNYVDALMKVERIPRENAQKELDNYTEKRKAWQNVNMLSSNLRKISNKLYSYENPFSEKTVESTNEKAITATSSRDAENASYKIRVDRVASADSFLSNPIDTNLTVPAGNYTFIIGDKTISFNWRGGKYRAFIETINKRGKGLLSVSEISTTPNSKSLLFKSEVLGESNRLSFADDALIFALENGIIKKNDLSTVNLNKTNFTLQPKSSEKISFSNIIRGNDANILEITLNKKNIPISENTNKIDPKTNLSNNLKNTDIKTYERLGNVSYNGITIINNPSESGNLQVTENNALETNLNTENKSQQNSYILENTKNLNLVSLESTKGVLIPTAPISDIDGEQKITIDLSEYGDVKAIAFNNQNSNLAFEVSNIRVYDPKSNGEYVAVNPVSLAQDAIIDFEGIKIQRSTNEISDLIPGVTLNLHDKTEGTETIGVKPDAELVKNAIIEFVANYNNLLTEINILTQGRVEIIDELTYLTDAEREAANLRLGLFYGDSTLNTIKNNLRNLTNSPYKADDESKIILLKNIGISTNSSVGQIEAARLRGYLEINEKELDEAIKNNLSDIKSFFGFDKNGDMLIDSGLAFVLYEQLTPYVQRGGIFANRLTSIDSKIKTTTSKISAYDKKLAEKEKQLKAKYRSLEGTLKDLGAQSDKIKSFSNQNNKGD